MHNTVVLLPRGAAWLKALWLQSVELPIGRTGRTGAGRTDVSLP